MFMIYKKFSHALYLFGVLAVNVVSFSTLNNGVSWSESAILIPGGATENYGEAVSLNGNFVAVGAPGANVNKGMLVISPT